MESLPRNEAALLGLSSKVSRVKWLAMGLSFIDNVNNKSTLYVLTLWGNLKVSDIFMHADILTYRMTDEIAAEAAAQAVERAADIFGLLSSPVRLHIVLELCVGEKSVSELLLVVNGKQPNMSQHLTMMCRAGLLGRRKQGAQVYYRIANHSAVSACRMVCSQVAEKNDRKVALPTLQPMNGLCERN